VVKFDGPILHRANYGELERGTSNHKTGVHASHNAHSHANNPISYEYSAGTTREAWVVRQQGLTGILYQDSSSGSGYRIWNSVRMRSSHA